MWVKIQGKWKTDVVKTNKLVKLLYDNHDGFKYWFDNYFQRWDGFADHGDEESLNQSIVNCLNELSINKGE